MIKQVSNQLNVTSPKKYNLTLKSAHLPTVEVMELFAVFHEHYSNGSRDMIFYQVTFDPV